ncbi:hypothetical protein CDO73_01890 [Saccharibacillus sp. O23]|uniref:hypothetical protein n=1 Tax=Saccharibacillus sp. O23 TaxID=2009338 RepID=UPI000B4E1397|nr:hypothetical protein [Saccharibacillus sp. O23]OWR32382.1 hypothetical protein CDO73_01890 [Saccharibacillus sp. O23]
MQQEHSLIFWARAKADETFDEAAEKAYPLMQLLMTKGEDFFPKYKVPSRAKNKDLPFEWTFENFKKVLRKGSNREGKVEFLDLGYSVIFASSLQSKDQTSIKLRVGTQHSRFSNTMIVKFPDNSSLSSKEQANRLEQLFKDCIPLFDPYWAAIVNLTNRRILNPYDNGGLSAFVHWLNYWNSEYFQEFIENKINDAPVLSMTEWQDGYLIKLQENPIDSENPAELEAQRAAKEYFGL